MARAVWSGAVSFGLVNVPVKAYTAVREHTVHFNQLEKRSGARVRYEKVSDKSGKELDSDDIELGYELKKGEYVVVDPDELASLRPRTTRTIDVADFVDLADIDPIFYARSYWLAPDGEPAERAYQLLLAAMQEEGKVGIGRVVMRNKQYLAAIRPSEHALVMSTMHFADEIVPASDVEAIPTERTKAPAKERKLAGQLIGSLSTEWDPGQYHDTYTEELRHLIDQRAKGKDIVVEEAPSARANVTDLMDALQASIDAAKKARGGKAAAEIEKVADKLAAASTDEDDGSETRGSGARGGSGSRSGARARSHSSGSRPSGPRSASSVKRGVGDKAAATKKTSAHKPTRKSA